MSEKQAIRRGKERHCVRNWDLPGHRCLCPRCQRRSARHISTGPATDGPVLHLEILARFRKEAQAVARAQAREARAIARAQARAGAKPKPKPKPSTLSNTHSLTHPAPAGNENNSSTTAERSSVARRTARALARKPTAEWPRGCVPPPATPLLNKCCALEFGWGVHYQCPNEGLHHHQGQLRVCETHFLSPEEGEANKVKDLAAQASMRELLRKEGVDGMLIDDSQLLTKAQLKQFVDYNKLPFPRRPGAVMQRTMENILAFIHLMSLARARNSSLTLEEAATAARQSIAAVPPDLHEIRQCREEDLAAQAKIRGLLRKEGMRGIHDSRLLKKSQLVAFVKAKNLPYPRKQGTARSPLGMLMPQNEEHYFAYIDLTSGARDDGETLEEAAAAAAKIMVDGDGEDIIRKWRKLLLAAQAETREFLRGMEMQDIHDSKLLKKSQLMAFLEAKKLAYPRLRGKLRPQNKEHYLAYIHLTSVARDDGETLEEAAAAAAKIMVDGDGEDIIRKWRKLLLAAQAETREFLRGMEMQDIHDSKLLKKSQLMAFLEAKKLAYPRLRGKLRPQNKEHYLAYIHLTSVARDDSETLEQAAAAAAKTMVDGKVNEQNIRTWRARKSRTPHGTTSTWGYDWRHFPASAPLQCPQHCRVRCYGDYMAANELTKPQVEAEAKRLLLARFPPVYLPSPCCQFPVRILCLLVGCGYMAAAWLFVAGCVLLTC